MTTYSTVHQVMEYGPIVASNDELDILITVNGSYFNFWAGDFNGNYTNTDCRSIDRGINGIHGVSITELMDEAEQYIEDALSELDEEE